MTQNQQLLILPSLVKSFFLSLQCCFCNLLKMYTEIVGYGKSFMVYPESPRRWLDYSKDFLSDNMSDNL